MERVFQSKFMVMVEKWVDGVEVIGELGIGEEGGKVRRRDRREGMADELDVKRERKGKRKNGGKEIRSVG